MGACASRRRCRGGAAAGHAVPMGTGAVLEAAARRSTSGAPCSSCARASGCLSGSAQASLHSQHPQLSLQAATPATGPCATAKESFSAFFDTWLEKMRTDGVLSRVAAVWVSRVMASNAGGPIPAASRRRGKASGHAAPPSGCAARSCSSARRSSSSANCSGQTSTLRMQSTVSVPWSLCTAVPFRRSHLDALLNDRWGVHCSTRSDLLPREFTEELSQLQVRPRNRPVCWLQ